MITAYSWAEGAWRQATRAGANKLANRQIVCSIRSGRLAVIRVRWRHTTGSGDARAPAAALQLPQNGLVYAQVFSETIVQEFSTITLVML